MGTKNSLQHGLMVLATTKPATLSTMLPASSHPCHACARTRLEVELSHSSIARRLLSSVLDEAVRERVKKKFIISFVLAKEHLPFLQYPATNELEERHGVDLGLTYKNRDSARN